MTRTRSASALLAWTAALTLGLAAFHELGTTMPAPPLRPAALVDWLGATDPTLATMSLLRLFVLALSWYLVGVTAIGILARLGGAVRLVRLADALTVPALRRLLQSALGLGLATAMVATATPARAQPLPLQLLEDVAAESTESGDPAPVAALPAVPAPVVSEHLDGDTGQQVHRHAVVAGESFWTIATAHLAVETGSTPSDVEITVYWRRLIEQNRSRLADPGNPDLLFPGQRLELPSVED